MSRCHCEWEDVYIKERPANPHCGTCACRRRGLEVRRMISRPVCKLPLRSPSRCRRYRPAEVRHCSAWCNRDQDVCLCYECRKVLGRSEATTRKKHKSSFCMHRHAILENWFTKYDVDHDGFLELVDLECLLNHLGVRCHTEKLFQICDNDCDGRLSFPEFARIWHHAARRDEDFMCRTGCRDLSHVVKEYNLFLDTECSQCRDRHCSKITLATEHSVKGEKCKCGLSERILPFIKHEPEKKSAKLKKKILKRERDLEDPDKYPTMSLNRDNIV